MTFTDNKRRTERPAAKKTPYTVIASMGELFFQAFLSILILIWHGILTLIAAILRVYDRIKVPLKRTLRRIRDFFTLPFIRYAKAMKMGGAEISKARSENGAFGAAIAWLKVSWRVVFGKRGWIVTLVNWALPICSCVFLFNIVTYANNQNYALKLTVNGDFLGYISNETIFTDAEKMVQKRINYTGSSTEIITFEPAYEVDLIGTGSTLNTYQLTDKLLEMLDADIAHGYGLYVGEAYYGTLTEHERVDAALNALLDAYRTGEEKERVEFDRDITYTYGLYLVDSFVTEDEIIRQLTSKREVASYYTVEDGDSPSLVCSKLDMTYEELARLNPDFNEDTVLHTGDLIQTTTDVPYLTIIITREERYNEPIPYSTEYTEEPYLYADNKRVVTLGEDGVRFVVANVSYINGNEISRQVLLRTTVEQPVTEVIAIGTKPRPADAAPGQTIEYGKLLWPVGGYDGGLIEEMVYGHGGYADYGGHKGIDILASYGTPIYAAANGVVVSAVFDNGYNGGRGNYVTIRHDDGGLSTNYYHMSYVYAYPGQRVTAGDRIGEVGMTGRAYGNHLHFEVRIGGDGTGTWLNPIDYLPWHARVAGISEW
ncbi:MAG: peptidoglycan DD-metalloendopeptidase family protein [Lachnospiraceae bacterium]|nr:peptidoglycan DD-metalloendopeptidase family protein [Ruminococcus sp.]MCM1274374.1 peptidoglycan DD-metalloendopeptidase family protein [Lachnospiraceae bacterium]